MVYPRKSIIALFIFNFIIYNCVFAQKEDYNWCFGEKAGINFQDLLNPIVFKSKTRNTEVASSISDSAGNLLFYGSTLNTNISLFNSQHQEIQDGTGLLANPSYTNGMLILSSFNGLYYVFHLGYNEPLSCPIYTCTNLFYTKVQNNNGLLTIVEKNTLVLNEPIEEKLAAVKHANGIDWWLLVHAYWKGSGNPCTNEFYKFLVKHDTIIGPYIQSIGTAGCSNNSYWGEMVFSKDGNHLAVMFPEEKAIDLFQFNRCNGTLSDYKSVDNNLNQYFPYSCEFSTDSELLYVSCGLSHNSGINTLFQYSLKAPDIPQSRTTIYSDTSTSYGFGQLQIAPNGMIYLAVASRNSMANTFDQFNTYLSLITKPDSLGSNCYFLPFSFYLGDSARSFFGLPNMPNYNLDPLSIYQADAGEEKTLCTEDTLVKGFFLGVAPISGVGYSWYPSDSLSDTQVARPFANPSQTTMYVVTLTDTSIKYSCQSREDTVWVIVKDCSVGVEELDDLPIRIYPNPATSTVHISYPTIHHALKEITITDISGKTILKTSQTKISVSHFSEGLYFIKVEMENGENVVRKVMIN